MFACHRVPLVALLLLAPAAAPSAECVVDRVGRIDGLAAALLAQEGLRCDREDTTPPRSHSDEYDGVRGLGDDGDGRGTRPTTRLLRPDEDIVVNIGTVPFEFDSAALTSRGRAVLDRVTRELRDPRLQGMRLRVEGHADRWGDRAYNQALSERRARAVADYLSRQVGVQPALSSVGFGSDRPLPGVDPHAASQRRVEFRRLGSTQN